MYLSQLLLNPHNRQVQREVGNPYQLHRTLMRGFPADLPADERVLYRLEMQAGTGGLTLLVQSIHQPDWSPLESAGQGRYLLQSPEAPKRFQPELPAETKLYFRLRANPTVKKQREGHKNSNRVPIVHEEKQDAWLQQKADLHGFRILQSRTSGDDRLSDWIRRGEESHRLRLYTVQFDGLLEITDADVFAQTLATGIGPARAFGCGLLSIAPAR